QSNQTQRAPNRIQTELRQTLRPVYNPRQRRRPQKDKTLSTTIAPPGIYREIRPRQRYCLQPARKKLTATLPFGTRAKCAPDAWPIYNQKQGKRKALLRPWS